MHAQAAKKHFLRFSGLRLGWAAGQIVETTLGLIHTDRKLNEHLLTGFATLPSSANMHKILNQVWLQFTLALLLITCKNTGTECLIINYVQGVDTETWLVNNIALKVSALPVVLLDVGRHSDQP